MAHAPVGEPWIPRPTPSAGRPGRARLAGTAKKDGQYDRAIHRVIEALEGIAHMRAPASEYLAALERAKGEIEDWIEASIDAARDDVKREAGE